MKSGTKILEQVTGIVKMTSLVLCSTTAYTPYWARDDVALVLHGPNRPNQTLWSNCNDGKDISRLPEDQQYALIGHKKTLEAFLIMLMK